MSAADLLKKYSAIITESAITEESTITEDSPAFDDYLNQNDLYNFEFNTRNLERVINDVCGYNSLAEFLGDNPGAQEAIISWIDETVPRNPEWQKNIKQHIDNADFDSEQESGYPGDNDLSESASIATLPEMDQPIFTKNGEKLGYYQGTKKQNGRITHLYVKVADRPRDLAVKIERFYTVGDEYHVK